MSGAGSLSMSSATKHSSYMQTGCIGSVSVGMPGKAVKGKNWKKHRAKLLKIFVTMLAHTHDMIGMLVCEVGSITDMYDNEDKAKFKCDATEHGDVCVKGVLQSNN